MRIEPATLGDMDELASLLADLFTGEADFNPEREKQLSGLRLIIENPRAGLILVARDDSSVVGMVSLQFLISTAQGGYVTLLEDMIVRAEYRGRGIGSLLLAEAVATARRLGLTRITLLTDADNDGAIGFYRRHGFQPSAMVPLRLYCENGTIH